MFNVNRFDLLTWVNEPKIANAEKRHETKFLKNAQRNRVWQSKRRKKTLKIFHMTRKIKTKIDCFCFFFLFFFFLWWIREAYCDSPKCSFIIRWPDPYNEVEWGGEGIKKKSCGLLLELTSMHLCHNHKSKHLFYVVHWAWAWACAFLLTPIYGIFLYFDRLDSFTRWQHFIRYIYRIQ